MPTNQSTEQFVDISDIKDNVVIMKNGSLRAVIGVSAINFELRSEDEQTAILQNFQKFINSMDFPLQIVVVSRNLNINDYLKVISQAIDATNNELIRIQGLEYAKFIKELSELANIMQKKFYVVVPFYITGLESATPASLFGGLKGLVGPAKKEAPKIDEQKFQAAQNQLLQRVELIGDGLIGLGVKTKLLEKPELMTLFYGLYNHDTQTVFQKDNANTF